MAYYTQPHQPNDGEVIFAAHLNDESDATKTAFDAVEVAIAELLIVTDAAVQLAQDWAQKDEDSIVEPGTPDLYSAFHWASKAVASATAAGLSEDAAALSETNAGVSETNAGVSETNAGASETAAGLSETAAGLSETAAGDSETAAATSAAEAAEDAAELAEALIGRSFINLGTISASTLVIDVSTAASFRCSFTSGTTTTVSFTGWPADKSRDILLWVNSNAGWGQFTGILFPAGPGSFDDVPAGSSSMLIQVTSVYGTRLGEIIGYNYVAA